ncbi:MAG TPA: HAD-IA family hydrolase, partial [Pirellulales bacterium]|nr:HAD-IA family hydrolase [Pirellulales bacterium]
GKTSEQREQLRWRRIVMRVFDDLDDRRALFDLLWRHFGSAERWQVDPAAASVWQHLTERGLTLGIASNFDARLESLCAVLAPLDAAAHVFTSSRLGWRKPSLEFFRTIEQRLGMSPAELLLVGDDLTNDYEAARAAGWHALLLDPQASAPAAVERISALGELPDLLDRHRV